MAMGTLQGVLAALDGLRGDGLSCGAAAVQSMKAGIGVRLRPLLEWSLAAAKAL
jgi:hypothetical protein